MMLREERRLAVRRVLAMVDRFLKLDDQDTLRTDGRGLMNYREIRRHVRAARRLLDERP